MRRTLCFATTTGEGRALKPAERETQPGSGWLGRGAETRLELRRAENGRRVQDGETKPGVLRREAGNCAGNVEAEQCRPGWRAKPGGQEAETG